MHNAIAHPRYNTLKNRVVGMYAPEGPTPVVTEEADRIEEKEEEGVGKEPIKPVTAKDPMSHIPPDACVYITNARGTFFRTIGKEDRWNRTWLLPEEALYLLERGTLDIRWPASITGSVRTDGEEELDLPMSLQAAYACLMGRGGLTLERFSVYTGLKRLGYTVIRAPSWDGSQDEREPDAENETQSMLSYIKGIPNSWNRFYNSISNLWESDYSAQGPLIGYRTPRHYSRCQRKSSIYRPCTNDKNS